LRTQHKICNRTLRRALGILLALLVPYAGNSEDLRLTNLAARAQDKSAWPALETLAQEYASNSEQRGRAYFVLGFREYQANEFQPAARHLKAAADSHFSLSDYAGYYGAQAARDAGEPEQGIALLADFPSRYSQSTLRWAALQLHARLLTDSNQPERAIQLLAAEPRMPDRPELLLELALACRGAGRPQNAVRWFQEIYHRFPLSGEAEEAHDNLTELRKELGAKFAEAGEDLRVGRADILTRSARWGQAAGEYSKLLDDFPRSPQTLRWKLAKARALFRARKTDQAVHILESELPPAPETDPERLQLLVEAAFRTGDLASAERYLGALRQNYPQSMGFAQALDAFGNFYVRRGDWSEAAQYYHPLAAGFPTSDIGREAAWRLTWFFYLEGDLNRARTGFVQFLAQYPDSDRVPGALYWLGRIDEQRGAIVEARAWFDALVRRYVHAYYAALARARLEELSRTQTAPASALPPASVQSVLEKLPARPAPGLRACGRVVASDLLQTYFVLHRLSLLELAEDYLLRRLEESPGEMALQFMLGRLRSERGATTLALYDTRRAWPRFGEYRFDELPEEFWRRLYPQDYRALVEKHAKQAELDPALVMGLIRQESAFNPQARSVANARGLMQILPSTVSKSRRGRTLAARRLFEPEYNIKFGTQYLRGRLAALGGVPEYALAAYHAGDSRVKDWRGRHRLQEPAEFLETIPIPSTRTYVEAVLRDAGIYRQILQGTAQFARCP
jgi:soluble lytic murein transglycosylase